MFLRMEDSSFENSERLLKENFHLILPDQCYTVREECKI
jgi:hypothetical protein